MANPTLAQLYAKHEGKVSDKWSLYLAEYDRVFQKYLGKPIRLLELGIQNGGSLEIWSKYFPRAERLVGCDINPECARLNYEDSRVVVVVGDANSDRVQAQIIGFASVFDVIIDDASHRSSDIVKSFARYFPYLADGGVFVVEDLHCSYWQEFEGGLFDPFSAITFFKRLADVVNYEHWGIAKSRADVLNGFFSKYGFQIDVKVLQHIHSVEFTNSICVIRKEAPTRNRLGVRVIAGLTEAIVPGHLGLKGDLPQTEDQTNNVWAARTVPPDEEVSRYASELNIREVKILDLTQSVAERDNQIVSLNQAVAERDSQIARLNQAVAERDNRIITLNQAVISYQNSTSWRSTVLLRLVGRQFYKLKGRLQNLSMSVQSGEGHSSFRRTLRRHLIRNGHAFYRRWLKGTHLGRLLGHGIIKRGYVSSTELHISALSLGSVSAPNSKSAEDLLLDGDARVVDYQINLVAPLNFALSDKLVIRPHINVLLPSIRLQDMSGGPNTALLLAAYLAEAGEFVRLIATDVSTEGKEAALYPHIESLFQHSINRDHIILVDGSDRSKPITIGARDIFLATAWWTAQMAKFAMQQTLYDRFIYLVQDFEPILHEGSTLQALALETYGFPHIPIINTRLLLDHLIKEGCGCYSQPEFTDKAIFFEPAINRKLYFPDSDRRNASREGGRRILLFYARPTFAQRNLFELGVIALRKAVSTGLLDKRNWEIWGMGESFDPVPLGNDVFLRPLPWMGLDAYAERIRSANLMLSLMLSPHPSYPPLEMAAAGKLVITNSYSVKTADRLQALSPNILVAAPTPDSIAATLECAIGRVNAGLPSYDASGTIHLPSSWDQSLSHIIPDLKERIDALCRMSSQHTGNISKGYPAVPQSDYEHFRRRRLKERRRSYQYRQEPGLFSFITTVYNTDPNYLEELAASIFLQDGGTHFEWLILDNGSTNENTRTILQIIAKHPCVRLEKVEKNLGIIGGMRYCLGHATGRYILPLDSDDLIEPDCIHVLTRFIHDNGFPYLLYTDEDKVADGQFGSPYFKSEWDPVLFINSCYIAHLCAMDRAKALALQLYNDPTAEGCHDWDSFIKFMNAGYVPRHVPEVLYSWRIHRQSTSGNIASKSYITDSHRSTLQRFLDHANKPHIELIYSPLFSYNVDWWFRRRRCNPVSCLSIFIGDEPKTSLAENDARQNSAFLFCVEGVNQLSEILEQRDFELVHLSWDGVTPDDDEWLWEATGLTELFPDTVMVGGTLHDRKKVLGGPMTFGFGGGYDCADRGRQLSDPGYFATMWKPHSVSAVSSAHCVIRCDFLKNALRELIQEQVPLNMLGPWLGALAREAGKRVVFSPFMRAFVEAVPEDGSHPESRAHFLSRFWHLLPDGELLSPRLGLDVESAYVPADASERDRHLKRLQHQMLPYPEWLEMERRYRAKRYPLPDKIVTLSILTAVYERSDITLLDVLADSITKQTLRPTEWLIVANGPISENDLQHIRNKAKALWDATLIIEPESLGIIGALRQGLELAQGQYIVPVDADDVLTLDAIQILTHEICRLRQPDLIYSDEDSLIEERPAAPYLRSSFDPVLNLDSSYIWHLLGIKREIALKLHMYADSAANWCQDWDSVMRVANAGGRIEHVAEVLYHWRHHSGSTTNKPDGDSRSLDSVRHVLEEQIIRIAHPERYSVKTWPVNRGAKELYIARRRATRASFYSIGDLNSTRISKELIEEAILVTTVGDVTIEDDEVFNEVARLFELHPNVAAVGGRILSSDDVIVEGCLVASHQSGSVEDPWAGHNVTDPGPYAIALKPQCVASTGPSFAFFRIQALKSVGFQLPEDSFLLSTWIIATCQKLAAANLKIVYSPLVNARTYKPHQISRLSDYPAFTHSSNDVHPLSRYKHSPHNFYWR